MRADPLVVICLGFCLYPLLVFGIPAYLIGRFRPHFRSPIAVDRPPTKAMDPQFRKQALRAAAKVPPPPPSSDIGYGG